MHQGWGTSDELHSVFARGRKEAKGRATLDARAELNILLHGQDRNPADFLIGRTDTLAVGMTRLEGIYRSNALAEDVQFFNLQGVTLVDNVWRDRIIPEIKRS